MGNGPVACCRLPVDGSQLSVVGFHLQIFKLSNLQIIKASKNAIFEVNSLFHLFK